MGKGFVLRDGCRHGVPEEEVSRMGSFLKDPLSGKQDDCGDSVFERVSLVSVLVRGRCCFEDLRH